MLLFYHNDIGMLLIQTLCIKMNLYHGLTYQEFKNIIKEIPLNYFQIEIDEQSYLIKPHFNLIIEVLNDIIYINLNDLETSTSIFQELIKNYFYSANKISIEMMYLNKYCNNDIDINDLKEYNPGHLGTSMSINFILANLNYFMNTT